MGTTLSTMQLTLIERNKFYETEIKTEKLHWVKNCDGKYQFHFKKPKDYLDGYCILSTTKDVLLMEQKDGKWITNLAAMDSEDLVEVENFDECLIFTFNKIPLYDAFLLEYRFDIEAELCL